MKLNRPKDITFIIAAILAVLGLIGSLGLISAITVGVSFWLVFVGFVLLAAGNMVAGL